MTTYYVLMSRQQFFCLSNYYNVQLLNFLYLIVFLYINLIGWAKCQPGWAVAPPLVALVNIESSCRQLCLHWKTPLSSPLTLVCLHTALCVICYGQGFPFVYSELQRATGMLRTSLEHLSSEFWKLPLVMEKIKPKTNPANRRQRQRFSLQLGVFSTRSLLGQHFIGLLAALSVNKVVCSSFRKHTFIHTFQTVFCQLIYNIKIIHAIW